MTRRAAIYARISKDREGAGLGVERQRDDCERLAERLGWSVVVVHTDNDLSAYSGKRRPGYQALLEDIRAGRVDAVLAWHNDRLHRSTIELETYIAACEPRSTITRFVQAGDLDLSTATGRMNARFAGVMARHEAEHMSERVKAQKARAAADGKWTGGGRPFGWTRDGMHLVPEEAEVIRDGVRRVLAGESIHSITQRWRAEVPTAKGGQWRPQNVTTMLARPRNAGLQVHQGKVIGTAKFPAIITEDEYHAVRAILKDPRRNTYFGVRSLKWLGSGLYICGKCGGDMRAAAAVNRDGTLRRVYQCRSTPHMKVNLEPVDAYVIEAVCHRLDREGATLLPAEGEPDDLPAMRDQLAAQRVLLEDLDDMWRTGEITRAGRAKQAALIEATINELTTRLECRTVTPLAGVADAMMPSAAFLEQPVARQRAIVDKLASVTVLPAGPGRPRSQGFDFGRIRIDWRSG